METLLKLTAQCRTTLSDIESVAKNPNLTISLFKKLLGCVAQCIEALQKQVCETSSKKQRKTILLCICQIHKCLPLLLQVLECEAKGNPTECQESKRYVVERMCWCLEEVANGLESPAAFSESESSGSKFVLKMDVAMDLISNLTDQAQIANDQLGNCVEQLRPVIEEVLCHAMTIVQISEPSDFKTITSGSQKILSVFEQLKLEYMNTKRDLSACLLFANSLGNALESLEQRVNLAVLRLVLQVFCDPYAPLKMLVQCCDGTKPVAERSASDLDLLIVEFDLLMDRVMQIGMFAMACTGDNRRMLHTRSCLASLESLEPELVPTLTSLYLEPASKAHRFHLKLLMAHWKAEVVKLHNLINAIVDPAAFCQVTAEEVERLVIAVQASVDGGIQDPVKDNVHRVIRLSKKLVRLLEINLQEYEVMKSTSEELPRMIRQLNQVCHECDACAKHVFSKMSDMENKACWVRVIKRCHLVVSTMKKVQTMLFVLMETTDPETKESDDAATDYDGHTVFPESVRDLPIDITSTSIAAAQNNDGPANPLKRTMKGGHYGGMKNLNCLTPYMDAGKQLRQERSIMYTPKRCQAATPLVGSSCIRSMSRPHNRLLFSHNREQVANNTDALGLANTVDETLELDITDILEKLTMLSDTLSSVPDCIDYLDESTSANECLESCPQILSCLKEEESSLLLCTVLQSTSLPATNSTGSKLQPKVCGSAEKDMPPTSDVVKELFPTNVPSNVSDSDYLVGTFDRFNDLDNVMQRLQQLKK